MTMPPVKSCQAYLSIYPINIGIASKDQLARSKEQIS
jgi:hypothetical protein